MISLSRGARRPGFARNPQPPLTEGAGNAGRSMHPQPCVQNKKAHKCSHHGHIGVTRHSPRDGFNKLPRALPGDQDLLTPSPMDKKPIGLNADLEASGPHGLTVRRPRAVHAKPKRPPHPRSTKRDDRVSPLPRERDASMILLKFGRVKRNSEIKKIWRFNPTSCPFPAPMAHKRCRLVHKSRLHGCH